MALSATLRELLALPASARTEQQNASLVEETRQIKCFANLTKGEHYGLATCWSYEQLSEGERLCAMNDENPTYFVVIEGSMEVEQPRLKMAESDGSLSLIHI